jgi:KRAB domain-containing zinc finger protein
MCGNHHNSKSKLIACIRQHVTEKEQRNCHLCAKTFPSKYCLRQHMKSHDDTMVACQICGKRVKPLCMSSHIKQVHTTVKALACETCGKAFKTKQNLKDHAKSHNKTFQCEVCGHHFSRGSQLTDHMLKHESPEVLACPVCRLQLSDRRALKKHVKNIHEDRPGGVRVVVEKKFKCGLCDYASGVKGNLKIHQRKHEKYEARRRLNPDAIKCGVCGALFASELFLKMHNMKVHSDERFPCGHCDVVLKTKNSMWNHVRKVHGIEPERRKKKEKVVKAVVDGGGGGGKKPRKKRRKRNEAGELVDRDDDEEVGVEVIEIGEVEYY